MKRAIISANRQAIQRFEGKRQAHCLIFENARLLSYRLLYLCSFFFGFISLKLPASLRIRQKKSESFCLFRRVMYICYIHICTRTQTHAHT